MTDEWKAPEAERNEDQKSWKLLEKTLLAGVQARFPGFVLKRTSKVDAHGGPSGSVQGRYLRFTWSLGPADGPSVVEGVDFCTLAPDGRLASVVGFIDKMPG